MGKVLTPTHCLFCFISSECLVLQVQKKLNSKTARVTWKNIYSIVMIILK